MCFTIRNISLEQREDSKKCPGCFSDAAWSRGARATWYARTSGAPPSGASAAKIRDGGWNARRWEKNHFRILLANLPLVFGSRFRRTPTSQTTMTITTQMRDVIICRLNVCPRARGVRMAHGCERKSRMRRVSAGGCVTLQPGAHRTFTYIVARLITLVMWYD